MSKVCLLVFGSVEWRNYRRKNLYPESAGIFLQRSVANFAGFSSMLLVLGAAPDLTGFKKPVRSGNLQSAIFALRTCNQYVQNVLTEIVVLVTR
jgi:hypothetical protein